MVTEAENVPQEVTTEQAASVEVPQDAPAVEQPATEGTTATPSTR